MTTLLMCEPRHFEVSYVINPWMAGNQGRVDRARATQQWRALHETLAQRAQIQLIEPVRGLPDMVFTANAGLVCRGREVVLASFRHAERQPEAHHYARYFMAAGYQVLRLEGMVFEGAGDALYDAEGRLWFGHGLRSDAAARDRLSAALRIEVHDLELVDPRWYHLDTAFCPLSGGYVLAYAAAFSAAGVDKIKQAFGGKVIWVSEEDARDFACNAVNLGRDIILYRASPALKDVLGRCGFTVIEFEMTEFLKAGGSCKCLTLQL